MMTGTLDRASRAPEVPNLSPATAKILAQLKAHDATQQPQAEGMTSTKQSQEHQNHTEPNAGPSGDKSSSGAQSGSTATEPKPIYQATHHPIASEKPVNWTAREPGFVNSFCSPFPSVFESSVTPKITLKVSKPAPYGSSRVEKVADMSPRNDQTPLPPTTGISTTSSHSSQSVDATDAILRTSGKGLGRGRPGIKRGPRKRKRDDDSEDESRKTKTSPSDDEDMNDYTPNDTQTKSGRQVHRPSPFVPPESPKVNKPRQETKPKKKMAAASAKGRDQNVLCEHCLRGNGPLGNVIVFCDGCNRAWHQNCHDPRIPREVVTNTEKDWFCAECIVSSTRPMKPKKGRPRKDENQPSKPNMISEQANSSARQGTAAQLLPGKALSLRQQRDYLEGLSREQLINHLLDIASSNPEIPVFPTSKFNSGPVGSDKPQMGSSTPATTNNTMPPPSTTSLHAESTMNSADDSDDEYIYDEHALLYPKAGQGIRLPPESEDIHMLLEGPDSRTFSHRLRRDVKPTMAGVRMAGNGIGVFG